MGRDDRGGIEGLDDAQLRLLELIDDICDEATELSIFFATERARLAQGLTDEGETDA